MHDVGNPGTGTPSSLDSVDGTRHSALGRDRSARRTTQRAPATASGVTAASVFAGGHAALLRRTSGARAPPRHAHRSFVVHSIPSEGGFRPLGKVPNVLNGFSRTFGFRKRPCAAIPRHLRGPSRDTTSPTPRPVFALAGRDFDGPLNAGPPLGPAPMSCQNASRIGCASRFPTPRADDAGTIRITVVTTDRRLP